MGKQMVEVDVPDGWEAVEYRVPVVGETILSSEDPRTVIPTVGPGYYSARFILRPVWQWPAWLKAPWIAMDPDGLWGSFENEPCIESGSWICRGAESYVFTTLFDFTPPPCTDWRQSKRKNPNL